MRRCSGASGGARRPPRARQRQARGVRAGRGGAASCARRRRGSRSRRPRAHRRTTTAGRRRSAGRCQVGPLGGASGRAGAGVSRQQVDEAAVHRQAGVRPISALDTARAEPSVTVAARPVASARTQPTTVTRPTGGAGASDRAGAAVAGRQPAAVHQQRRARPPVRSGVTMSTPADALAGLVADHHRLRRAGRCRWPHPAPLVRARDGRPGAQHLGDGRGRGRGCAGCGRCSPRGPRRWNCHWPSHAPLASSTTVTREQRPPSAEHEPHAPDPSPRPPRRPGPPAVV